ncbi:hypothetical protein PR001_g33240 [Phytophthora rubi]|uniref:Uncharacterized protein n=1 Tax=Phytophthora rubi TaxID=129364 RepID=A0A6A3G6L5_9STRA|nr:hypothetical protein PR001_g33240 [Phytophthora rubi]
MAHRNLDGPIQGGRRGRKAADARQQAAAVSGSVAEADSDACTADAKLRMSGSSGDKAGGGVQATDSKQRI